MPTTITAPCPVPTFDLVPFHEHEILAARADGAVRVPMKRFCETLGLEWPAQRRRISRDEVLAEGVVMMTIPSEGGDQAQVTLPIGLLPGFLFGADSARYAAELRGRIKLFRTECFEVLHRHFAGDPAPPVPVAAPPPTIAWQELAAARREAPALIAAIKAERRPAVRRYLYALLTADCARLDLPAPALADLGEEEPPADSLIARLFAGLETLEARRDKWNHLGRSPTGRAAIILFEIAFLFARADIDVEIDDAMRAALRTSSARYRITEETIRSAITKRPVLVLVLAPWPNRGE